MFTLLYLLCSPILPPQSPLTGLVLSSSPTWFKQLFIDQRGFACKYIVLQSIKTPLLPFPFPCIVQQLSVCFIIPSSYTDAMYFNIIHSFILFFLSLSLVSSNCPTIGNMFSVYVYMIIRVFMYTFIFWIYPSHLRETM
jgi:hypothetical protein